MESDSNSLQRKAKSKKASESSTGMDSEDSPMRFVDLRRFLYEIAVTGVELQTAVDNRPSHTDCVIACRREQSRNTDMKRDKASQVNTEGRKGELERIKTKTRSVHDVKLSNSDVTQQGYLLVYELLYMMLTCIVRNDYHCKY